LYYSYTKLGDINKANNVLRQLQEKYPDSELEKLATNASKGVTSDPQKASMTKSYDSIYSLFIEGRFDEALILKKTADSLYSHNYWTPQLLYIESIYYVRQRQDSAAKAVLQKLTGLYPSSPMSEKAKNLLDVLNRRNEIESYLTNLQITRPTEDSTTVADTVLRRPAVVNQPPVVVSPTTPVSQPVEQKRDTAVAIKRDTVGATKRDTVVATKRDTVGATKRDTVAATRPPIPVGKLTYSFNPELPHAVVIVMDKVDAVYVSESRNAFNRYNKEKYANKPIEISNQVLNDTTRLVVMTNFENASAALEYLEKTRAIAAREIVPWLPAGKYDFIMISLEDLEVLRSRKDVREYRRLLTQSFPGKF
jgi:tetratricopeptide (TPR) repeat protein